MPHFEGYGAIAAHTVPEPGKDGDDGKAAILLLLGRSLDGDVQVQWGTGPDDHPLRSPAISPRWAPPPCSADPDQGACVVGIAPNATPGSGAPARHPRHNATAGARPIESPGGAPAAAAEGRSAAGSATRRPGRSASSGSSADSSSYSSSGSVVVLGSASASRVLLLGPPRPRTPASSLFLVLVLVLASSSPGSSVGVFGLLAFSLLGLLGAPRLLLREGVLVVDDDLAVADLAAPAVLASPRSMMKRGSA